MNHLVKPKYLPGIVLFPKAASVFSFLVGCLVLFGWQFDITFLKSVIPNFIVIMPNTAVGFMLCGASLWFLTRASAGFGKLFGQILAIGATLLGLLTLGEFIFNRDIGIDRLLFNEKLIANLPNLSGRMAQQTALNFVLLGISLLLLKVNIRRDFYPAQWLSIVVFFNSLISVLGYGYNVPELYTLASTIPIALPTALIFLVFSLGVFFVHADRGLPAVIWFDSPGGFLVRRLLPAAFLIHLILGWLRIKGERVGIYSNEVSASLFVASVICFFLYFIWRMAHSLDRADAARQIIKQELLESEERLRLATETAQMYSWEIDLRTQRGKLGKNAAQVLGIPFQQLPATLEEAKAMIHSEDREAAIKKFDEAIFLKTDYHDEFRVTHPKTGETLWIESQGTVIYDKTGKPLSFAGVSQNITGRKNIDLYLRKSEEQLAGIIGSAMDAIITVDEKQNIVLFNAAAEKIFMYQKSEIIGQSIELLIPERFRGGHKERVNKFGDAVSATAVKGLRSMISALRANGEEFPVEASISQIEVEGENFYTVILRDITERKRAEEALRAKENHFRSLIENSSDAFVLVGREGKILYASPSTPRVLGYLPEELVNRNSFEFIHPDDQQEVANQLTRSLENPRVGVIVQTRVQVKDGSWRWCEGTLTNLLDDPNISAIINNFRDITERRQAEEALRAKEHYFRSLIENSSDGVTLFSEEGKILYASPSTPNITGWSLDEMINHTAFEFIHPDDAERVTKYLTLAVENPHVGIYAQARFKHKDGSWRWCEGTFTNLLDDPVVASIVNNFRDITERKQAEEEQQRLFAQLKSQQKRLDSVVSSVPGIVWEIVFEPDAAHQRMVFISDYVETILGYSAEEWVSTPNFWLSVIHPDDRGKVMRTLLKAVKGDSHGTTEYRCLTKDGNLIWVSTTGVVVRDENGNSTGVRGVTVDITERKKAETEQAALDEKLLHEQERLNNIISSVPGMVWESQGAPDSPVHSVDFVSDYVEHLLGYTAEEMYSKPGIWFSLIHPDDVERLEQELAEILENREKGTIEYRLTTKTGEVRWVESSFVVLRNENGKPIVRRGVTVDITERKKAEAEQALLNEKLRHEKERLNNIISSVPGMVWESRGAPDSPEHSVDFISDYIEQLLGYTTEEANSIPDFWYSITHPEDSEKARRDAAETYEKDEKATTAVRVITKTGEARWVESNYVVIKDKTGKPVRRRGVVTDITERKKAEAEQALLNEKLRHEKERLNNIISSVPGIVWESWGAPGSPEYKVDFISDYIEQLLGYTAEEANSRPDFWSSVTHPEDFEKAMREVVEIYEKREKGTIVVRLITKIGEVRWVESNFVVIKNENGKPIGLRGVTMDISERKKVEEFRLRQVAQASFRADIIAALAKHENSIQGILNNCCEAIVKHLDAAFARIWTINHNKNMLELQASAGIYTHLDGAHSRIPVGAYKIGLIAEEQMPHITNDVQNDPRVGDKEWARREGMVAFAGYPLIVERKLLGVMALFARQEMTDDTLEAMASVANIISQSIERKRAQEELQKSEEHLRQSQKMEAIGRLAGGVAHDFNNMLTAINGYSELAMRHLNKENPARHHLEEINKAGERAADLTQQLLAFSRKQVLQPKIVNFNAIVSNIEKMLRRLIGEDVELHTILSSRLGCVKADPGQIDQVIMNLVVNARDAMPKGGKLTIETKNVFLDPEYTERHVAVSPGNYVLLAISDTGIGMNAETQAHIFDPFFTTKEQGKGTGLGLATVYGIVKQSGGSIWVYSEVGIGTTFKIYLPRVNEAGKTDVLCESSEEKLEGTETILLVEDEDIVRKLAFNILESYGYRVLEACDGEAALSVCRDYQETIHLLITDAVMPGINGRELADRTSILRPEIKVLYMSGYTDDAIINHGILKEDLQFIQKPFSPVAFMRKIREVLKETGQ